MVSAHGTVPAEEWRGWDVRACHSRPVGVWSVTPDNRDTAELRASTVGCGVALEAVEAGTLDAACYVVPLTAFEAILLEAWHDAVALEAL